MAAGARRFSASLFLGALAAGLAAALGVIDAEAAVNPISISAHVGYSDAVKLQEWMPASITVTNDGPEVEGTLEVSSLIGPKPGVPWPASYQRSLVIGRGATKHFRTYLVEEFAGLRVNVRITRNGRILASQDAATTRTASTLVGVLSDDSAALDDLASVHPGGISATVVHLALADLPDSPIPLRAFDLVAVDDFATDGLSASQRAAIDEYVRAGGSLLIGTGASWRRTLAGLPATILPMQPSGLTTLASSTALGGLSAVQIATGPLSGGTAWLSEGAQPLLAERLVGAGSVTFAAFDWKQDPIAGWTGTEGLLRQVLARTSFGDQSQQGSALMLGGPVPGPFGGGQGSSVYQRSGSVSQVLGNLPALDLPSLLLTGVVVLIYVLLVGPVNYFVLGAFHRRALSWITLPLIAVVVAGASYGGAILTKGQSVQTNQVAILHLQPGSDRAYQETYTGVLAPTRGDYEVKIGEPALVSNISANDGFGGSGRSDIRVNVEDGNVALPGMTAFTLRGFATEAINAGAPRLNGQLRETNGQLTGSLENLSGTTFTDAVVISGDGFQRLGTLAPGARVSIGFMPKVTVVNGPPALLGIYPNYMLGPQAGAPTAAQRDGQTKTQILSLLVGGGGFKGLPTNGGVPLVVAWTRQSFEDLTVNGARPRANVLTAVAMQLPVEELVAGPLPAAVVNGRIVDVEGGTQSGPPGVLMIQNGSVTFEFTPALAPGAHLTGASLSASNPYFIKGPAGPTGPISTVRGEAWDWARSAWTDVAFRESGTTALPEAVVNPATGGVRLQVAVGDEVFMATGISLTGTVQ